MQPTPKENYSQAQTETLFNTCCLEFYLLSKLLKAEKSLSLVFTDYVIDKLSDQKNRQ